MEMLYKHTTLSKRKYKGCDIIVTSFLNRQFVIEVKIKEFSCMSEIFDRGSKPRDKMVGIKKEIDEHHKEWKKMYRDYKSSKRMRATPTHQLFKEMWLDGYCDWFSQEEDEAWKEL